MLYNQRLEMRKRSRHNSFYLLFITAVLALAGADVLTAATVIKVSLITPEGSAWTNALHRMAREVQNKTSGAVELKIYAGGISGDEFDVLRKMRISRIHAAGFSGVGLGIIVPKVRILEAPLLYENSREIDLVRETLFDEFADAFERKGYILLGFAEAGFVYFFSKVNMSGPEGFKPVKMWVWKGDPVARTSLEVFGIKAYPLHLADVNTGLETGMINSFYSPPLAAIAFQWHSKIQYMLNYPMVNSTGALLLKKDIFDTLSKKNQAILREVSRKFCNDLIGLARKENIKALKVLQEVGIVLENPSQAQILSLKENAKKIYQKHMGDLYPVELFQKVQNILKTYRKSS
jgi:TRAP-type C4-dicarboxylate transport system substrate-binding protein